ncbi:MAG: flagellar protein FliT [Dehalococcoidia bacterium]|nr:flagellar protein FliT [Dehalococcoidia bacterium]
MDDEIALGIARQLKERTLAQLAAVRAGQWDEAADSVQQRGVLLQRLQAIDPSQLSGACRQAIAALLEEVRTIDRDVVSTVEAALEATRAERRILEKNDAAARGYRRALGAEDEAGLIDEEA